jgi:hypothetical protein
MSTQIILNVLWSPWDFPGTFIATTASNQSLYAPWRCLEERQEDLGRPKALAALVAQTQGDSELRLLPLLPLVLEVAQGDLVVRPQRREDSEMPPLRRHRDSAHLVDLEVQPPPPLEASVVRLPPLPVDLVVSAQPLLRLLLRQVDLEVSAVAQPHRHLLGASVLLVDSAAQPLPPVALAVLLLPGALAVAVVVVDSEQVRWRVASAPPLVSVVWV